MIKRFVAAILITLASTLAYSEDLKLPEKKAPWTRVHDYVSLLSLREVQSLNDQYRNLEKTQKLALVVAIVPNLADSSSIEEYTTALFAKWGIGAKWGDGTKPENNGILCVIAMKEKKLRCETGYGAEGVIPDLILSRVFSEKNERTKKSMLDYMIEKKYYEALSALGSGIGEKALRRGS